MAFEDNAKALYERAYWIESMEGTIKYSYKEEPDDVASYTSVAKKRVATFMLLMLAICIALLFTGIALHSNTLIGLAVALLVFLIIFAVVFMSGLRKNKSLENKHLDEVKLAFNAHGVVFRVSSDLRVAVFAYVWSDFESIVEYDKVLVGIKQNVAYIFPKRVFSEEEYNIFRRFSYAALGKKCVYKNFKQQ